MPGWEIGAPRAASSSYGIDGEAGALEFAHDRFSSYMGSLHMLLVHAPPLGAQFCL